MSGIILISYLWRRGAVEESYVWLRDRYLFKDNLNVWKEVSLHKEYRFIHQGYTDSFPDRTIEEIDWLC